MLETKKFHVHIEIYNEWRMSSHEEIKQRNKGISYGYMHTMTQILHTYVEVLV